MILPIDGRAVEISDEPGAGAETPLILLIGEEGCAQILAETRKRTSLPFTLAAVPIPDWDAQLSPWEAPRVFRGGQDFGGGAGETLEWLTGNVVPALRAALGRPGAPCCLAGYSLAGLFALYALWRSPLFSGALSASGSLWFPGFSDYAAAQPFAGNPERVYLSLGDRESRTRNPVMRTVEEHTRRVHALLRDRGVNTVFEMNPGNHFQEPELRLAKGIAWLLEGAPAGE